MAKKMLFLAIFISVALVLAPSHSMAASITGRVIDQEGAPLPGAQVTVVATGSEAVLSTTTEADGSFLLDTSGEGVYTITIRRVGFVEQVHKGVSIVPSGVPAGNADPMTFRMRPSQVQAVNLGNDELNPNIFVVKLDVNSIQRQLGSRGALSNLKTEFSSIQNSYGEQFGFPMRHFSVAQHGTLLSEFHGSLYESHQNSAVNARSFFTVGGLQPSRRNDFGATISGPIKRDSLSFSLAWGEIRETGFVNGNIQVPLPEERAPLTTDPATRAVIERLLTAYPEELPNLTNITKRQLNTNARREISSRAFTGRLDWKLSDRAQITYEQRFFDAEEIPFELVTGQNPVTFLRPQSAHLRHTRTISPTATARLALNYDRLDVTLKPTEKYKDLLAPLGISSMPEIVFGRNGDLSNLGPGTTFPRMRVENRFHVSPEFTWSKGNHTLTAGGLFSRLQINDLQSDNSRGSFVFGRNDGRSAVENFLLGRPTSFAINLGDFYRGFRNWEHAVYFHDRMRVRDNLTVSLGLRYEIVTAPTEVNQRTSIPFGTDANNLGPQIGFAWNLPRGYFVLRGGYGLSFSTIYPLLYQRLRFNPPDVQVVSLNENPSLFNPLAALNESGTEKIQSGLNLVSPDLVSPYMHIYSLGLEKRLHSAVLLRVGYVGSRTLKLPWKVVTNRAVPVDGIPTSTSTVNLRRPDQNFGSINSLNNGSISYYDSLHLSLDYRQGRLLTLSTRYVFSKAINTGDSHFADIAAGRHTSMEPFDIIGDLKGVEYFDTPHLFTLSYRNELPATLGGRGLLSHLFSGWRTYGTLTLRSGTPYMLHTGSDAPGFGNVDGLGQDRPHLLNTSILGKSIDHPDTSTSILRPEYFDPDIPAGGRGNLGFNTFRKDGTTNLNFALEREFALRSGGDIYPSLQFRAEFFNFFNHPQFDSFAPHISNEIFGKITNTVNRGRLTQFFLRLRF